MPEREGTGPSATNIHIHLPRHFMLIGLTGRNASGKSTLVEWFSARGMESVSCSDSIRKWLSEQGIEATREELIKGGRELRREGGPGVLAEMLLESIDGEDAIVDSIRTPAEVEALRSRGDFVLIEVTADVEVRWGRMVERGRFGDAKEKATFLAQEEEESESEDDAGQALNATAMLADMIVVNDGSKEDLEEILGEIWEGLT
ncbi:MAG TPA: AAA family ATPase [Candidatus Thalassarchaeaceae archaeon]|nr:AAA family ATPase [Candidatus Thalassarchaeaceae archaeon]